MSSLRYLEFLRKTARLLPGGGTTGQVLAKTSDNSFAVAWTDAGGGGSTSFTNITGQPTDNTNLSTLRSINVSSAVNLGLTSSTATNYATILRRTVTFATAAPDPWNFTNSDRVAGTTPPSIRFRAA